MVEFVICICAVGISEADVPSMSPTKPSTKRPTLSPIYIQLESTQMPSQNPIGVQTTANPTKNPSHVQTTLPTISPTITRSKPTKNPTTVNASHGISHVYRVTLSTSHALTSSINTTVDGGHSFEDHQETNSFSPIALVFAITITIFIAIAVFIFWVKFYIKM